jgi:RNA polymerase sigma factor (TIGR02999 family)
MNEVTQLLQAIDRGDAKSADELLPMVYEELRRLAASKMAREAPGQTLQPTALVHEAWLRLVGGTAPQFNGRAHFFGAAAEAMRRILIDRARRKAAQRHGGGQERVDVDEVEIAAPIRDEELLAVNEALDKFAALDAPKAELVKLRFFAGLTIEQAAAVLGISEPTANRWWAYARAWLFEECKATVFYQK